MPISTPSKRQQIFAIATAAALPLLGSGPAKAVSVTVGGTVYDVMVSTINYSSNSSSFAPLPLPGQMPWWGNDALASEFAGKVAGSLGEGPEMGFGPVFAYEADPLGSPTQVLGLVADLMSPTNQDYVSYATTQQVQYAVATEAVPGPLPILGATAAFGWSRQLRRRMGIGNGSHP